MSRTQRAAIGILVLFNAIIFSILLVHQFSPPPPTPTPTWTPPPTYTPTPQATPTAILMPTLPPERLATLEAYLATPTPCFYTVPEEATWESIAISFSIPLTQLQAVNPFTHPLQAGQVITLPLGKQTPCPANPPVPSPSPGTP